MPRTVLAALALLVLALGACQASRPQAAPAPGHACCPVCTCRGDLPCIDVNVDGKTPWVDYQGQRYYFCSEDCRCDFEAHPQEFMTH